MDERWLPVPGFEGAYEVSDMGRVRSLDRVDACGRTRLGRILKPSHAARMGYCQVRLSRKPLVWRYVHALVLTTFVGPRPDGAQCRHLNGDHLDNRASNLAWGTSVENHADRRVHGTGNAGERHGNAKLTNELVLAIRAALVTDTQAVVRRRFGVTQSTVNRIATRKAWSHL